MLCRMAAASSRELAVAGVRVLPYSVVTDLAAFLGRPLGSFSHFQLRGDECRGPRRVPGCPWPTLIVAGRAALEKAIPCMSFTNREK